MSDEVKKAQEEAQKMAQELGIYEIVRNVVNCTSNTSLTSKLTEARWGGCRLILEECRQYQSQQFEQKLQQILQEQQHGVFKVNIAEGTSIVMENGMILYHALFGGELVTTFRYGSWIEKLELYSEQVSAEKARADAEKAEQERQVKLASFAPISDDEFEKMVRHSEY
ncbi:MAG TPA: hypothetical protein PKC11_11635 [Agitococcus sp.]|nr:hypothetical protein [Agitococcus sp.]HMY00925.1 hypothetical protein [Agitococcus sp.]HNC86941.1 hypothetical protein [Agitococcus sp.]HNJ85479.1 hypothetical protein [Agitococcus sp.]